MSAFCALLIGDVGNIDLTGHRAVDGSTDNLYIYMEPEENTALSSANAIPFQPIEGLFLKLQVLRH